MRDRSGEVWEVFSDVLLVVGLGSRNLASGTTTHPAFSLLSGARRNLVEADDSTLEHLEHLAGASFRRIA